MNVFLDTNVYLSFFHLSPDDLEQLKKFAVLARQKKLRLLLPSQVRDEFRRNREAKIADSLKRLKDHNLALQLPQLSKQYTEFNQVLNARKQLEKALKKLIQQIEDDARVTTLDADSVVEELFNVATEIPITPQDLRQARLRIDLGNPPGKRGSLGDALNWQALLRHVRKGSDLFFISDDGDFYSQLSPSSLHEYLRYEWIETKTSELHAYPRLSAFLADRFPDIKLSTDLEKDLLIEKLLQSSYFAEVHQIISSLSSYANFTRNQVNVIVTAAITNNQIYWIARDPDILSFFNRLLEGREDIIDEQNLRRIRYVLDEMEPYGEIPF